MSLVDVLDVLDGDSNDSDIKIIDWTNSSDGNSDNCQLSEINRETNYGQSLQLIEDSPINLDSDESVVEILDGAALPELKQELKQDLNMILKEEKIIDEDDEETFEINGDEMETSSFPVETDITADYASDENAIFVSAEIYDREKANFDCLVEETLKAIKRKDLLEAQKADSNELIQAASDVAKLNSRLQLLSEYVDSLRVEKDGEGDVKKELKSEDDIDEKPSWSHLFAGVNKYRHKVEGTVAEFYQHKSNIISGLKSLYEPRGLPSSSTEIAEQPKALLVSLLKHQESGLKWLLWRETQKIPGGILADDMGLGKTLSMIALILASLEQQQKQTPRVKSSNDSRKEERQYQLYHLQQSSRKRIRLFDSDSEDDEVTVLPPKQICLPKVGSDQDDDSDDNDMLLPEEGKGRKSAGTLIVCPMSVMSQWANEVASKVKHNVLKTHIYHGGDRRNVGMAKLRRMNVVITSYHTVVSEWKRYGNDSWLFALEWKRLILDEAHIIRNSQTIGCQTVTTIKANYRWALTGTPIQNRALDCFALLKFLGVPNFKDLNQWRRYLNEGMAGHRRMSYLIKPLMLRRTKQELQATGAMPPLPPLEIKLIDVTLSPSEMAVYKIISAISLRIFAQFLHQREQNNQDLNYYNNKKTPRFIVNEVDRKSKEIYERFLKSIGYNPKEKVNGIIILVLLLRLRQFCCHPGLMVKMLCGEMTEEDSDELHPDELKLLDTDVEAMAEDEAKCFLETDAMDVKTTMKLMRPSNPIFDFSRNSAKLHMVLDTVNQLMRDTNDKIIVVSQWTSFLSVIKQNLESSDHETLDLNGTMNAEERCETLKEFNNVTNNKRILLLSLTAGGVGLNLNVANHLLLVDLHWNPQLERQAQDRIYRYGQKKPSVIYRFMCIDTVEQRIKALQDYKMEISKVILNPDDVKHSRGGNGLTLKDLKKIFGMA